MIIDIVIIKDQQEKQSQPQTTERSKLKVIGGLRHNAHNGKSPRSIYA